MAKDDKDDAKDDAGEADKPVKKGEGKKAKAKGDKPKVETKPETKPEKAEAKPEPKTEKKKPAPAKADDDEDDAVAPVQAKPAAKAPAKAAAAKAPLAHGDHAPNRREYLVIFVVLAVLTALEVGLAQIPGISKTLMAVGLIALAVTKAAVVGLYYMHLKHETRVLRLTVAIPMATPAIYALVLISEAAWRLAR